MKLGMKFWNTYKFEVFDKNHKLIATKSIKNLVTYEGLDNLLSTYFLAGTPPTLYVGLISSGSFSAIAQTDTAAQIGGTNGWLEEITYTEAVRQTLTLGVVASQSVDNSLAPAVFTFSAAAADITGAFLTTDPTLSGTGGILYGEAAFNGGNLAIASACTVNVTVTLTAATA